MKKLVLGITALLLGCFLLTACGKKSAESQEESKRYITVINETDQVIKKLTIRIKDGKTLVTKKKWKKDDEDFEIPAEYEEDTEFVVTLVDRYDGVYEKNLTLKEKNGRYDAVITEKNMTEEGDAISRKLNGN